MAADLFAPTIPPDLAHAGQVREEALDWLERTHRGVHEFPAPDLLRMTGESDRRWLIGRLRRHGIGRDGGHFSLPDAAAAVAVLFLRREGVKFRDAVDAVLRRGPDEEEFEPRWGGVWNRLVDAATQQLRRTLVARLVSSAVFALQPDPKRQANALVIIRASSDPLPEVAGAANPAPVDHDAVYQVLLERPAPLCAALSPGRDLLVFPASRTPSRSEVTTRRFVRLRIDTHRASYEMFLGGTRSGDSSQTFRDREFVGRVLDLVFLDLGPFLEEQAKLHLDAPIEPEAQFTDGLQLWLITQFLVHLHPGSLAEVVETSEAAPRVLASSAAKPWDPSPWGAPSRLHMLTGYAGELGVPLVVPEVRAPWSHVVGSVEQELRYLSALDSRTASTAALALPIPSTSGESLGALYLLAPSWQSPALEVETRVLAIIARVAGELIEFSRANTASAAYLAGVVSASVLGSTDFRARLLDLLTATASEIESSPPRLDLRLPFLLLAADRPNPDEAGDRGAGELRDWLVGNLRFLEWRSWTRARLPAELGEAAESWFAGALPQVGMVIALGQLVTKEQLDRIRSAFPGSINRLDPPNAPVRLLAWVLDVPARRLSGAAQSGELPDLATDIEQWAFEVTSVLDDVAVSQLLADEDGDWEAALARIRRALQRPDGRSNTYLHRLAAECAFSLGDWPSARAYAHDAVALAQAELGSGIRSLCLEADSSVCLGDPVNAWDLYSRAADLAPRHPLPRYYRGQGALLIARLLDAARGHHDDGVLDQAIDVLAAAAMEDLAAAGDLLNRWGLIPESSQYRNFHLIPTMLGQGAGYLLQGHPGPAASRLQSARRTFPKDDLFFREYLFAKCLEQGTDKRYAEFVRSPDGSAFLERLLPRGN